MVRVVNVADVVGLAVNLVDVVVGFDVVILVVPHYIELHIILYYIHIY